MVAQQALTTIPRSGSTAGFGLAAARRAAALDRLRRREDFTCGSVCVSTPMGTVLPIGRDGGAAQDRTLYVVVAASSQTTLLACACERDGELTVRQQAVSGAGADQAMVALAQAAERVVVWLDPTSVRTPSLQAVARWLGVEASRAVCVGGDLRASQASDGWDRDGESDLSVATLLARLARLPHGSASRSEAQRSVLEAARVDLLALRRLSRRGPRRR